MSGCSAGMSGSMFCESCHNYDCSDNPKYYDYHNYKKPSYEDKKEDSEDFYEKYNLKHMKGVKAPDIPIVENIQEETKDFINKMYDNFLNL